MLFATQNPPGTNFALLWFLTNATSMNITCTVLLHAWLQNSLGAKLLVLCATSRFICMGLATCGVALRCVLYGSSSSSVFTSTPWHAVLLIHPFMCTLTMVKLNAVILTTFGVHAGQYGGRKVLSRAFRSRFLELHVGDLPDDELEFILQQRCALAPSYSKKLVGVMRDLYRTRQVSACSLCWMDNRLCKSFALASVLALLLPGDGAVTPKISCCSTTDWTCAHTMCSLGLLQHLASH